MNWADVLAKFGLPTAIALGLAYLLQQEMAGAREERAQHTVLLIEQMTDLREKVTDLHDLCEKK